MSVSCKNRGNLKNSSNLKKTVVLGSCTFLVEVADEPAEWDRGLMYRKSMAEDEGMLFVFPDERPRTFWMKDTLIPLDMYFFDKNKRLISVHTDAAPLSTRLISSNGPTKFVLEAKAGSYNRCEISKKKVVYLRIGKDIPK